MKKINKNYINMLIYCHYLDIKGSISPIDYLSFTKKNFKKYSHKEISSTYRILKSMFLNGLIYYDSVTGLPVRTDKEIYTTHEILEINEMIIRRLEKHG